MTKKILIIFASFLGIIQECKEKTITGPADTQKYIPNGVRCYNPVLKTNPAAHILQFLDNEQYPAIFPVIKTTRTYPEPPEDAGICTDHREERIKPIPENDL